MGNLISYVSRSIFLKKDYVVNFKNKFDLWAVFVGYIALLMFYLLIGSKIGYLSSINFCFGFIGFIFLILAIIYFFADEDVKFARDILNDTMFFAKNNNLLIKEMEEYETYDKEGKKIIKRREVLSYFPEIMFRVYSDKLIWIIRSDGHVKSKDYGNYGKLLEGRFKLILNSVEYDYKLGSYIYEFRRKDIKRGNVSEILDSKVEYIVKDKIILNDEYEWNFRKCPHGLFTGITGSGKTYFFAYLIVMFLKIKASFRIIDPKRADLFYLNKYFGEDVVYTKGKALKILRQSCELIDFRMEDFQSRKDYAWGKDYSHYKVNPYFIVFDEAAAFVALLDKKDKEEYDKYVAKIILEGRQAGVFLLFAMQRADAGEFIKGALRDQLGLRIVLGSASVDGYKMVFGNSGKDLNLVDKTAGFYKDLQMDYPKEFYTPFMDIDFIPELEKLINYKPVEEEKKEIN